SELELFHTFMGYVLAMDPDILTGYELHAASFGYLADRLKHLNGRHLCTLIGRIRDAREPLPVATASPTTGGPQGRLQRRLAALETTGRMFLNVWRLMRSELTLTSYTLENAVWEVLRLRVPHYTARRLTAWWAGGAATAWQTAAYYVARTQWVIALLDQTQLIARTSEFARVYGVDFFSVISRGSQYKVESVMARICRPENFMLASPSRDDVKRMRAPECLPLIMEPAAGFYASPLLVLDFQSLYPSVMITYNYCYSTCLGRVAAVGADPPAQLGAVPGYRPDTALLAQLLQHDPDGKASITISPNGVAFLRPHLRTGVLGRMLSELLATRVMVKNSMKRYKDQPGLSRILNARQLSLKLLANVTYGYAGASYSGRMPCAEIADAIVQTGRSILEHAIDLIHREPAWQARVVYGDTDSLFVYLPGRSKDHAFQIGTEMVNRITATNRPGGTGVIKLKFEKVYLPSVLLAKKRYVGNMFEFKDQREPTFDAKGIEVVRRDNCPVVAKSMEVCLKLLFRTQDLSLIRRYLTRQWAKLMLGRCSVQDFVIAKEVKLGTYSADRPPPPGAIVAGQQMQRDRRVQPQYGERVPYVVVYGGPGSRLMDLVVSPMALVHDPSLRLHGSYYITKQIIPALGRVLHLVGVDLDAWFRDMPKQ
ncbi:hypothetical protein CXG81DRAFT_2697, partial [Caulochytrium protostelioides]